MAHSEDTNRRKKYLWLIFALALVLRFWKLGAQSFWADEALTIGMYKSPPQGISYFRKFLWDVHGPLYSMILHFWSMVSSSEYWLRTPSALAGALAVPCLYSWLHRITSERTALLGALFLALSPFSLYYSQELRFYSPLLLFSILSLMALQRFYREPDRANSVLLGITLGLTCLFHFSAVFLLIGLSAYMMFTDRLRGKRLKHGIFAAIISLLIISPWIYREIVFLRGINIENIAAMPPAERLRGELTLNIWSYPYIVYAFSAGYSFGPSLRELHEVKSGLDLISEYGLEIMIVFLLFVGVLVNSFLKLIRGRLKWLFIIVPVVSVLCLTAVTLFNIKVFNVRYLMPIFPLFIGLLAAGIPRGRISSLLLAGCLAAVMLMSDVNYFYNEKYFRDDIRGAVEIVEEREKAGDSIILQGIGASFDIYYEGNNRQGVIYLLDSGSKEAQRTTCELAGESERVWNLRARGWQRITSDKVYSEISKSMRKVDEWKLPGVTVYLFEKKEEGTSI